MKNLKLYLTFIKMKYACRMAYRLDFFLSIIAMAVFPLLAPVFASVIYYSGANIAGWSLYELLLLQGISATIQGFSFVVVFGLLWNTHYIVKDGSFDALLLRPINTLWLLIMDSFDTDDVSQVIIGLAIFSYAFYHLENIHGSWLLFLLIIPMGFAFFFSFALLASAAAIRFIEVMRLYELVDILIIFTKYPKTFYSEGLGVVFTAIIPLFIAGYYPASALLGLTLKGLPIAIVSVTILLTVSLLVWHKALKSYTSAGG